MGAWISKLTKKGSAQESHVRRVYIGTIPELGDEVPLAAPPPAPPGRKASLPPSSSHSLREIDEESNPSEIFVPVRRQSFIQGEPEGGAHHPSKPRLTYPHNEVISSRYTLWTFFPKNLYEQFRRVVNFYFLVVAGIQLTTDSPVSPVTSIAPLIFVVTVTMIKQGYEDWLRHKADNLFNNRPVKVIRDGMIELIRSKDVRVGDIVKLEGEEQVPCDIVLLGSSDEFQRCLINTANLDGETNLKMHYVPPGLPHIRDESDFTSLKLIVECEQPCEDLYRFNGNILVPPDLQRRGSSWDYIHAHAHEPPPPTPPTVPDAPSAPQPTPHPPPGNPVEARKSVSFHSDADIGATSSENLVGGSGSGFILGGLRNSIRKKPMKTTPTDFNMIFLGIEHIILRGTKVKNTDFVYGVVIYTGPDTRLARNSNPTAPKFSTIEKTVNRYLFFFIGLLLLLVGSATALSIFPRWLEVDGGGLPWYIGPAASQNFISYFQIFASFLILFNYIIPISLYVTMEMQKFVGSKFFVWDEDLSWGGSPALCNTSDLNEELGQIQYLFSDKTGTLTENVMKTRMFSIAGKIYELVDSTLYQREEEDQSKKKEVVVEEDGGILEFTKVLALCHSIQIMPKRRPSVESSPDPDLFLKKKKISSKVKNANSLFTIGGGKVGGASAAAAAGVATEGEDGGGGPSSTATFEFQGSSPDEKALVEACLCLGIAYEGEKEDVLSLNVCGAELKFRRHMSLEFDADRKCMSVIVEDLRSGEFFVLTKGAESSIIPRCDSGFVEEANRHVLSFAMMGLRTLVIAQRKISRRELEEYKSRLKGARRLVEEREKVTREIYRDIESHLHALGATGVEDQLQDGVVETLHSLAAAGIRVWVLTGDKVETATAVAYACGLLTSLSKQLILTKYLEDEGGSGGVAVAAAAAAAAKLKRRMDEMLEEMELADNYVLLMDGETLELALKYCPAQLSKLAMRVWRVICCRMTPLQKSQVVRMVKDSEGYPITAAIGDGANDCAMIQEAHIGLGIIGKEGRQAARVADFAIARFGFLRKAILVHGHWYYVRLANLANYFFYKNIVFVIPQLFYCFSTGFSTTALFNSMFLMMYNIFYTACPILIYGLLEQPYPATTLLQQPHLYKSIRRNGLMAPRVALKWFLFALWHSAVIYFFAFFSWSSFYPVNDLSSFGTLVFSGVVLVVNLKLAIESHFISWVMIGSHAYSYLTYFAFSALYSEVDLRWVWIEPGQFTHVFFTLLAFPLFWMVMLGVGAGALGPDLLAKGVERSWDGVIKFFKSIPKCHAAPKMYYYHSQNNVGISSSTSMLSHNPTTSAMDTQIGEDVDKPYSSSS